MWQRVWLNMFKLPTKYEKSSKLLMRSFILLYSFTNILARNINSNKNYHSRFFVWKSCWNIRAFSAFFFHPGQHLNVHGVHSTSNTVKVSSMTRPKLFPSFPHFLLLCVCVCAVHILLTMQRANRFGDKNSDTKQIACVIILLQRLPTPPKEKLTRWQKGVDSCTNCTHNDNTEIHSTRK